MSPSEADLRAALRDGEGDGVDPYDIIYAARQARARRRTALLSAAAAVVFVGAGAAGIAALGNGGGSEGGGANSAAGDNQVSAVASRPGTAPYGSANGVRNAPVEPGTDITTVCTTPAASPTGSGKLAGRSEQLLPAPVKTFIVCTYANFAGPQSTESSQPVVVTGPAARSLARSLRAAMAPAIPANCPMVASTGNVGLRLIPIAPDNRRLPPLLATVGLPACASNVSNGVVIRYGWRLPPDVRALLHLGTIQPGPLQLTPFHKHPVGSPPR